MAMELKGLDWANVGAPTGEDIEALAEAAFRMAAQGFRDLCGELIIQVVDFADDETLDEMGIEFGIRPARAFSWTRLGRIGRRSRKPAPCRT